MEDAAMIKPIVYLVLKTGKEYNRTHVARLRDQIKDCDVKVLSDDDGTLRFNYPGWWSKLELCRPDIHGDVFYMDLDTTVVGPIAHLATVGCTTFLSDFYRPNNLQSSMMYLTDIAREKIWSAWSGNEASIIAEYSRRRTGLNGDQNFIEDVIGTGWPRWQNQFPGQVVSYKVDVYKNGISTIMPGVNVIIFHGRPRPWETRLG